MVSQQEPEQRQCVTSMDAALVYKAPWEFLRISVQGSVQVRTIRLAPVTGERQPQTDSPQRVNSAEFSALIGAEMSAPPGAR